ncbi:carbohydrate ABC transporter permease [Atribacter laminatus]|uniref:Trehalose transport system permease protein SugB n=1 Tax=Atribacter laminatus TaxID=2847778 RepID=A0A7T1ANG2_ATRLM|nr:carbohydrate ABC transporter permease [Atribacter laminatus]QPM69111.1 Trehalose transport system permease protein SugB [Atribacter laminatus]
MNYLKHDRSSKSVLDYIIAIIFIFAALFPIYWILTLSLKNQIDSFVYPPTWIFKPIADNYIKLFVDESFVKYLINSLVVSIISVGIGLVLGAPAAYALSRLKIKGIEWLLFIILCIRMIPPMSLAVPFFTIFAKYRMIDTYLGLIIVYLTFTLPLIIWILKAFFDEVPQALEECAVLEGCSTFQVFRKISLPLISEATVAAAILSWIFSWNEFLFAMILTRESAKTAPVMITSFMKFEDLEWGLIAAASMIIAFPVVIFGIFVRRYLVSGLTSGALKE